MLESLGNAGIAYLEMSYLFLSYLRFWFDMMAFMFSAVSQYLSNSIKSNIKEFVFCLTWPAYINISNISS